ncbi:MAG: TIGR01906 family membrane protein [Chloroflexi bacterium]|nr:TIGR01906 family membrane protein [Chloroflexota bacterium]
MNKGPILPFFLRLFWTLAIPFLLTMTGARLLLSEVFLEFEYQRPGFPSDFYGFTLADRLAYGPYALRFLFNGEPIDYLAELRLPGENCWNIESGASDCRLFSDRELEHMRDVKEVASLSFAAALACIALGGASIVSGLVNKRLRVDILLGIRRGCMLTLIAVACLALLSLSAWDRAFDLFHQLFFPEGTWRFPFSDSLIRLYPEQLFFDAAVAIALLVSMGAALIFLAASRLTARNFTGSQR